MDPMGIVDSIYKEGYYIGKIAAHSAYDMYHGIST